MLRKVALLGAVLGFVLVGGVTVRLQVRASLRTYQLARERERAEGLRLESQLLSSRADMQLSPERVLRWVLMLRSGSRGFAPGVPDPGLI